MGGRNVFNAQPGGIKDFHLAFCVWFDCDHLISKSFADCAFGLPDYVYLEKSYRYG